jgi:HSP20 family protein
MAKVWVWGEAVDMLARAERLQRQMFSPNAPVARRPCWEPPVDVIETEDAVVVLAALPGVDPEEVHVALVDGALLIAGRRVLPPELRHAAIHLLELPQGQFERRVAIPPRAYHAVRRSMVNGCLVLHLSKIA